MKIETSLAPLVHRAARPSGLQARGVDRAPDGRAKDAASRDEVTLSPEALALAAREPSPNETVPVGETIVEAEAEAEAEDDEPGGIGPRGADGEPLTREETTQLEKLQSRDREVRAHEEAHKAAAGDLALGGPSYEFERGPDGQDYAVGGEVQIALKRGRTPEETISNAQRARRAALAPAEPSAQDRKVAAEAAQMENEARSEELQSGSDEEAAALDTGGSDEYRAPGLELLRREEAYRATASALRP